MAEEARIVFVLEDRGPLRASAPVSRPPASPSPPPLPPVLGVVPSGSSFHAESPVSLQGRAPTPLPAPYLLAGTPSGRPPLPPHLQEEDLASTPDVATKRATDRAIAAGLADNEVKRLQEEINAYANAYTKNKATIFNREFSRLVADGKSEEDARRQAKEIVESVKSGIDKIVSDTVDTYKLLEDGSPPHRRIRDDESPIPLVGDRAEDLYGTYDLLPEDLPPDVIPVKDVDPYRKAARERLESIRESNRFDEAYGKLIGKTRTETMDAAPWVEGIGDLGKAEVAAARFRDQQEQSRRADLARRQVDSEYAGRAARRDAGGLSGSLSQLGLGGKAAQMTGSLSQLLPAGSQASLAAGAAELAAGPVGIAIAVASQIKEAALGAVRAVGEAGGRAASLDTGVLFDGLTGAMEKFGPFGELASEATRALKRFADGLSQTAERLAPYSGALASAEAMKDARQIVGDVRRASLLGGDLAQFVEARSQLEDKGQDLLAKLIKPLIPLVTNMLKGLQRMLDILDALLNTVGDAANAIPEGARAAITFVSPITGAILKYLGEIAKNTGKELGDDQMLTDLLNLVPADVFRPPAAAVPGGGGGPNFGGAVGAGVGAAAGGAFAPAFGGI